jgi:predicted metal-dependent hydrolase
MSTQFRLPFGEPAKVGDEPVRERLVNGRRQWPVSYVRHRRARHYVLRVEDDGSVRVTIPRGGSRRGAEEFALQRAAWIERERDWREMTRDYRMAWQEGTLVLWRGESYPLQVDARAHVARLGPETIPLPPAPGSDLREVVIAHLRAVAKKELVDRVQDLATDLGYTVTRVTIRDQRTRWGSCSPGGRISLNWRLIQMPDSVRDYVLLHELTHIDVPSHSKRFWKKLQAACPWHRDARIWLRGLTDRIESHGGIGPIMPTESDRP